MGEKSASDLTAFVLAGGKSSRMGSDKAFLELEGRTLLSRSLTLARSVTADVRIVGSREKFQTFAPVVEDIFPDRGPLAGIHAALRSSRTQLNLMLAVDMPFVSQAFLQYLVTQARAAAHAAVIVPRQDRRQTLCAIYRHAFAEPAESGLLAGRNRIDLLFDTIPIRLIDETELQAAGFSPQMFRNLNTPADLEVQPKN